MIADLGRQPRAGARLRAARSRGSTPARDVAGRERAEDRGRRAATAPTVDLEAAGPTEAFERLARADRGDRPHARPPVRRPARDRRPGDGRARDRSRTCPRRTSSSSRSAAAGSSPGIATARRPAGARVIARRARALARAARRRSRPASRCRSTPSSIADGLERARSPASTRSRSCRERGDRVGARHRGRDRGGDSASSTRARSSPASPPEPPRRPRCSPGRSPLERGETVVARRLGRQRGRRNRRLLSWLGR